MLQQTKPSQLPASSPSRPRRPGAEGTQGSGSHRGLQPRRPAARRPSDCRKPLLTPRFDRRWGQDRGGSCVQEESEYEYASYHSGTEGGKQEAHIDPAVLYQSLGEAAERHEGNSENATDLGFIVPFCTVGSEGPCAHLVTWIHRTSGRTVRVLCTVVALQCGATNQGDETFESYVERNAREQTVYASEQRYGVSTSNTDDLWEEASEDGSMDDD